MPVQTDVADWWRTQIIDMKPGHIAMRGYDIRDLIGGVEFADMIWLMTGGELPNSSERELLNAVLVSSVDHGPQAPSIAASRMAVTCGLGLNGAIASAVNFLDDVHGGAGEQAVELFRRIAQQQDQSGSRIQDAISEVRGGAGF